MAGALAFAGLTAVTSTPAAAAAPSSGTFNVLTYNVAGLPEGLSSGSPEKNTPLISPRLGAYEVVNVQEDFNYHAALYAGDNHPYRTATSGGVPFGDGLNTLSAYPFGDFARVKWDRCNGTDCLTPKGFTFARVRLAEGVFVDLYNVHANAGSTDADLSARRTNIDPALAIRHRELLGNAVIIMGDTNTRYTRAGDNIRLLVRASNGLTDAWVEQVRGGVAPALGTDALVCPGRRRRRTTARSWTRSSTGAAPWSTSPPPPTATTGLIPGLGGRQPLRPLPARRRLLLAARRPPGERQVRRPARHALQRRPTAFRRPRPLADPPRWRPPGPLSLTLDGGTSLAHGGTGGTAASLTLAAGEHLA